MTSVFPPRNLPGGAEPWGRHIEGRIEGAETSLMALSQTSRNDKRFTGGQLAVFSGQVTEQVARTTLVQTPGDLSVTGNATVEPFPRATRNFSFPNPGGGRAARVEIYVDHDNSNFGTSTLFAYLSYQGSIISKLTWGLETDEVVSFTGTPLTGSGLANIVLPLEGPVNMSLTIIRVGFTSTPTTETVSNIRAYLTPSQRTA